MKTNKPKYHIIDRLVNLKLKRKFGDKYKFKLNYTNNIINMESINEFTSLVEENGFLLVPIDSSTKEVKKVNYYIQDTIQSYYRYGLLINVNIRLSTLIKKRKKIIWDEYTLFS